MAGFDLNILEISLIIEVVLMAISLWKQIPFLSIIAAMLGLVVIGQVLLAGNVITYYTGAVLNGTKVANGEVDITLSGLTLFVLIVPVLMAFYIALRGIMTDGKN